MSSSQRRLRRARARAAAVAACTTQKATDAIVAEVGAAALQSADAPRRTLRLRRLERSSGLSWAELQFLDGLPDEDFERVMEIGARPFLQQLAAHALPAQAAE